jgi:transposase
MEKIDARSLSSEAQEVLRKRAVEAVLGGQTRIAVAALFGVSRVTVGEWVKKYRAGGERALDKKPKGRPKEQKQLVGWQAAWVVKAISDKTPDQLKLPFALWTREAVRDLIAQRFGVEVSIWTVGRWLKGWGFTPQKPMRRAWEQDAGEVKAWLKEEYPRIHKLAKQEGAEIHWGDEMGMRSDHQTGRSYARKGKTPVLPGTGQRFGCNMISTVTNRGTLRFMIFRERFTAQVFIGFLQRLIKSARHKVFLILDRHPVHRSKKLQEWLLANQDKIRLFFLPAYSPELNPDELLNNDVKSNALGRRRPANVYELMQDVRSYLHSTQRQPTIVQNYFKAPSVCYAQA